MTIEAPKPASSETTKPPSIPTLNIPPFETLYSVPLHCQSCIDSIKTTLTPLPGISTFTASLPTSTISITGTCPPSAIVTALQASGKDAILRGSGKPDSAAVCILETLENRPDPVRGLARVVEVGRGLTVWDLTVRGVREGRYKASIRRSGDVSSLESVGGVWEGLKGELGDLEVDKEGRGALLVVKEVGVQEVVGRAMVVEREGGGEESVLGVIARSAGVWENDKTVCACSGKTLWEERKEQIKKGIV